MEAEQFNQDVQANIAKVLSDESLVDDEGADYEGEGPEESTDEGGAEDSEEPSDVSESDDDDDGASGDDAPDTEEDDGEDGPEEDEDDPEEPPDEPSTKKHGTQEAKAAFALRKQKRQLKEKEEQLRSWAEQKQQELQTSYHHLSSADTFFRQGRVTAGLKAMGFTDLEKVVERIRQEASMGEQAVSEMDRVQQERLAAQQERQQLLREKQEREQEAREAELVKLNKGALAKSKEPGASAASETDYIMSALTAIQQEHYDADEDDSISAVEALQIFKDRNRQLYQDLAKIYSSGQADKPEKADSSQNADGDDAEPPRGRGKKRRKAAKGRGRRVRKALEDMTTDELTRHIAGLSDAEVSALLNT